MLENKILTVKLDKTNITNKNITGLIANQLMGKYQRPVLVLNQTVHQDENDSDNSYIMWEGSGRNADGTELKNFQAFLQSTGLIEYAEGHENALGVGIKDENIDAFIQLTNQQLENVNFDITYDVDFIYNPKLIQGYDILEIAALSDFWGKNVEEPYIAIENVKVFANNIALMKGTTLKITLADNPDISLIKFKSSEEEYESLYSEMGCVIINIIGRCSCNSWDNKPQVKIEDFSVVGRQEYYF